MFGRRQDYSYALPDPQAIIRRRHHIRIWKTQYTLDGVPLWAAHDATLEYAKAGHLVNHIINPNVDVERDFIGNDIATKDARRQYIQSKNPVTEADTTSGHPYGLTAVASRRPAPEPCHSWVGSGCTRSTGSVQRFPCAEWRPMNLDSLVADLSRG